MDKSASAMLMAIGSALTIASFLLVVVVALLMRPVFLNFFSKVSKLLCSDLQFTFRD